MYQIKLKSLAQGIECGMVQLQEPPIEVQMMIRDCTNGRCYAMSINHTANLQNLAEKKRGLRKNGIKPAYLLCTKLLR